MKANRKAAQAAETTQGATVAQLIEPHPPTDESAKAAWPVSGPEKLTIAHVPQRLRDELLRPYLAACRVVAQALLNHVESRNDVLSALDQAVRHATKDSQRLNQQNQAMALSAAMVKLGIAAERNPGEVQNGQKG